MVITGVDANSVASDKPMLVPGSVIVAIEQEPVSTPADVQTRVDRLKRAGKRTALLHVAAVNGEMQFVAVSLQ